jgi:hypothetical protein
MLIWKGNLMTVAIAVMARELAGLIWAVASAVSTMPNAAATTWDIRGRTLSMEAIVFIELPV